jgi:hypothetical protein
VAFVLNCKIGHISFIYLGLLIGGNAPFGLLWLIKFGKKLLGWKSKNMYMIPIYFLSFLCVPTGIVSSIASLFKYFYEGGRGGA